MPPREEPFRGSSDRLDVAPDEELARRALDGETAALEQLVRRYLRPIHAVAAAYLQEPADVEDAAQETFFRAVRGLESYDPRRPFAPWLYQIARNVVRNHRAAGARWQTEFLSTSLQSALPGPDVVLARAEVRARVDAAVARLPEQQRMAFYLGDVEGYTAGEIALLMGLSAGTVRSHVHHARRALRAALMASPEPVEHTGE